jgi:Domain of unknown function (DUF4281)
LSCNDEPSVDALFSAANTLALVSWVALIMLPRRRVVAVIRTGALGGLALLYGVLIAVYFFRVDGGGFFSLPAVQRLFTLPEVALAGWVHYLAFDLFVGLWIAETADRFGLARWFQAPILLTTFMFGPIGFLMFQFVRAMSLLMPRAAPQASA